MLQWTNGSCWTGSDWIKLTKKKKKLICWVAREFMKWQTVVLCELQSTSRHDTTHNHDRTNEHTMPVLHDQYWNWQQASSAMVPAIWIGWQQKRLSKKKFVSSRSQSTYYLMSQWSNCTRRASETARRCWTVVPNQSPWSLAKQVEKLKI
jgi:hypothetical protein